MALILYTIKDAEGSQIVQRVYNDAHGATWLEDQETGGDLPEGYQVTQEDVTASQAIMMNILRVQRNKLLADSDWTQLADSPLSSGQKSTWATYRQALRDLPEQADLDPNWTVWPNPPA